MFRKLVLGHSANRGAILVVKMDYQFFLKDIRRANCLTVFFTTYVYYAYMLSCLAPTRHTEATELQPLRY